MDAREFSTDRAKFSDSSSGGPEGLPRPTRELRRLESDIDEFGFCFVDAALTPSQVAKVHERLAEQAEAERAQGHHKLTGSVQDPEGQNQWISVVINKGSVFQHTLFHPTVSSVLAHVLGPAYRLSEYSAHLTRPGASLLPLHTDQWWMPQPALPHEPYTRTGAITRKNAATGRLGGSGLPIHPACAVNAMWMISDFTEENGATRLIPRSHLSGAQPKPTVPHPVASVPALGRAGNVVMWDARTWHAAGANRSSGPRYGIVNLYCAPQFRSLDNFTLGLRPEVLDRASPELRALLGFKPWPGYGRTGSRRETFARPGHELIGELRP